LPAALAMLWRTTIALPIVPSAEQLNIATFVIARQNPAYLALDFTYGSSNPSHFYTPLQIDLFEAFWRSTGSVQGAIAAQTALLVAATMAAAGLSTYFLTHRALPALVVAAAALNYRAVLSGGEIWGLGPTWAVLPRAWAAVLVFGVIALWLRAIEARSWRYHVSCGLLAAGIVNVHPPTGAPLSAAIIGASFFHSLFDHRRWRETLALSTACAVGALPFFVGYLSTTAIAAPVDYEQFMAAARLRVDTSVLPRVLETLTRSLTPGTDSFVINAALTTGVGVASITALLARSQRGRLRELALLSVLLLAVSVLVPLAAQEVLMRLGRSPMPTIDLFRGLRLLVPIGLLAGGLGMAAALSSIGWQQFLALPIAGLIFLDIDAAASAAKVGVWLLVVAALAAVALSVLPALRRRPVLVPTLAIACLLIILPLLSSASFASRVGSSCCDIPPQPATERSTDELIRWVRTLPDASVFETSAVEDNAAMRMRIETKHGVTWIAKDGNVLLYSDPAKAILWGARSNRAHELVSRRDVAGLRSTAHDYGASLVLVDHLVWPDPVAGANIAATWSGIAKPTPTDWVGVFAVGQPDNEESRLASNYTGGTANGSVGLTITGLTFDGTYEIRLFASDSWNRLAASGQFKVVGSTATVESIGPTAVEPRIAVSWSGITVPVFQNDRFTVFRP
jgi:hypothetical protein